MVSLNKPGSGKSGASSRKAATPLVEWSSLPEGALLLVDTAPFIYHLEDNAQFAHRFAGLFEAANSGRLQIALTTITLAEILAGPYSYCVIKCDMMSTS